MNTKEILDEMLSLPIEQRAFVADSLLKSLNPPITEIDKQWLDAAELRLHEIRNGQVKLIKGEDVFNKIWNKYSV